MIRHTFAAVQIAERVNYLLTDISERVDESKYPQLHVMLDLAKQADLSCPVPLFVETALLVEERNFDAAREAFHVGVELEDSSYVQASKYTNQIIRADMQDPESYWDFNGYREEDVIRIGLGLIDILKEKAEQRSQPKAAATAVSVPTEWDAMPC